MLTIDSREQGAIEPVRKFFEKKGIPVVVAPMQYGDYLLEVKRDDGSTIKVLIERKTVTDFVNSTTASIKEPDSKLARQLNGCLTQGYDEVVLLMDGTFYPLRDRTIRAHKIRLRTDPVSIHSRLRTISLNNVRVEWNMAEWFLPQFIYGMYQYYTRSEHRTLSTEPKPFAVPSREPAKWTMLMGIRGVGPSMARALIDHFKSIEAMAAATEKELQRVKGVGPKLAARIHWYLH